MKNHFENDMNSDQNNLENQRNENELNVVDNNRNIDTMDRAIDNDKVLVGIFETENEAINVIRRLKETGYQEADITVLAKDKGKMEQIEESTDVDTKTKTSGEQVGKGAAIGAVLGGIAAALPALGLLVIPGIGPLLAAGPIAIILGGVITGGVAGSLVGVLVKLGVGEEDAKEYENYIEQGKILVLVENRENLREDVNATFRQNNNILADHNWHQEPGNHSSI